MALDPKTKLRLRLKDIPVERSTGPLDFSPIYQRDENDEEYSADLEEEDEDKEWGWEDAEDSDDDEQFPIAKGSGLSVKDLSRDQREVYDKIKRWADDTTPLLTVGGYAGTGKSTLLGVFAASTSLTIAYVAFTGRAASVLRRKLDACGVRTTNMVQAENGFSPIDGYSYEACDPEASLPFCGTLHRLLYKPIVNEAEEIVGWHKRESFDRDYSLIVIDEASMVGDEMLVDIQRHKTPILAVGDHGQLPPVKDSGSLMLRPKLRLEKIHRQAEGNPIIQLSRIVREEGGWDRSLADGVHVCFEPKSELVPLLRAAYKESAPLDVGLLCWTNRMRVKLNGLARTARGIKGIPAEGEIILWLKNRHPVYNGMRGVLTEDSEPGNAPWLLDARIAFPEESLPDLKYILCAAQFNREKTFASLEELHDRGIPVPVMSAAGCPADFGYAMTIHKSQGSSFQHAMLYTDMSYKPQDEMYRRLVYTAVTRASDKLTIFT